MGPIVHQGSQRLVNRLREIRAVFTRPEAAEKATILLSLADVEIRAPYLLVRLHRTLSYLRAFPDNARVYSLATQLLAGFEKRIARCGSAAHALDGTGIAGTRVHYVYSYPVARWLHEQFGPHVDIDWDEYEDPERLDAALVHCLAHSEEPSFEEGDVTTQDWIKRAKGSLAVTDLGWVMAQLHADHRLKPRAAELYDAAEIPLVWRLTGDSPAVTHLRDSAATIRYRSGGMRRQIPHATTMIRKHLPGIQRLTPARGQRMVDIAIATLATRNREVYSFNYANPREVYVAPLGRGTQTLIIGVSPERRLSLEANYGYFIMSNGVPIGYGGVSPLFHQANTGINILEEYRQSEAPFLFAQTLRAFHTLFGSKYFIANPYQFGQGNSEAIGSGAFWFYYRFGFRPVDAAIAGLADAEYARLKKRPGLRSDKETLRALSGCDVVLTLHGSNRGALFQERWLPVCATGCTRLIADRNCLSRARSIAKIVHVVARALGVPSRARWPASERQSFERMALLVALAPDLQQWSAEEKRTLVQLMRAKGRTCERHYATRLQAHDRFRRALADYADNKHADR